MWKAADKLRKNIDAAEYKHIVLGLIFLKYISDAFDELYKKLQQGEGNYAGADPEDKGGKCVLRAGDGALVAHVGVTSPHSTFA